MKKRLISAIVALIIVIPLIILGGYPFYIGIALISIIGYKEFLDLKVDHKPIPAVVSILGLFCLCLFIITNINNTGLFSILSTQNLVIALLLLITPIIFYKDDAYTTHDALYLLGVVIFLGVSFSLIGAARLRGLDLFCYLLLIPIITDTFAYIMGSKIGKNKLCPRISPNKTWEGSISGFVAGTIIGIIIYGIFVDKITLFVVLSTAILSIVGQMGDLVLSKVKRENKIKDFSNLMPGHGGIMDRLDSLIFVTLTYFLLITIF